MEADKKENKLNAMNRNSKKGCALRHLSHLQPSIMCWALLKHTGTVL